MKTIIYFVTAIVFFSSSSISAEDMNHKRLAEQKAQQAIDACRELSEEDRNSGVTSRMRLGAQESSKCVKDHILELSRNVLFKDDPDTQREVEESLQKINDGVGRLYWLLHNEHQACRGGFGCGTMYTSFHNSAKAEYMETILQDFYQKIAEYDLSEQ